MKFLPNRRRALYCLAIALFGVIASTAQPASAAPTNDAFANAIVLSSLGRVTESIVGATGQSGEPAPITGVAHATVWFTWTAPITRRTTFDTELTPIDTVMSIYTGTALNNLVEVASDDDGFGCDALASWIEFSAVQGTTYYIQVGTPDDLITTTSLRLAWNGGWGGFPSNDNVANAATINPTANSRVTGTTMDSTSEPSLPVDAGLHSVWFKFTASFSVEVTVSLADGINNNLYGFKPENEADLYTGTLPNLSQVDYADAGVTGSAILAPGETMYIGVQADLCLTGNFALTLALANMAVPGIPASVGALPGNSLALVAFSAPTAGGSPITSYTVRNNLGTVVATGAASPILVPGLQNGIPVSFTLAANNQWGQGSQSAPSNTVTPTANSAFAFTSGIAPTVIGAYVPIKGDFNGDGFDDELMYRAGSATDRLMYGQANGRFVNGPTVNVTGTFVPVTGDFDGDGMSDVFWYSPGTGAEYLWYGASGSSAFTKQTPPSLNGTYQPIVGDFNNDQHTDVLWYSPGSGGDYLWLGASRSTIFTKVTPPAANGTYSPLAADFNGDHRTDILWYGAGTAPDAMWYATASAPYFNTGASIAVNLAFVPILGDFNGDAVSDVYWYTPGAGADYLWTGSIFGFFKQSPRQITGAFSAIPADYNGDGATDLLLYSASGADYLWRGTSSGFVNGPPVSMGSGFALPGDFNGDTRSDIFLYSPTAPDALYLGN